MALPGGLRQVLSGALAAVVFLTLYFGLNVIWWLAFVLAAMVYFALLLVIRTQPEPDQILVGEGVSAADLNALGEALAEGSQRIARAADAVPKEDRSVIAEMSERLRAIHKNVEADPKGYRSTRRFATNFLPVIVSTVESYGALASRAGPEHADRLNEIGRQIGAFAPVIQQIDRATLEHDLVALETEVSALSTQLNRGTFKR